MTPYGTANYAALYATGTLLVLPPLILFIAFQKYFTPNLQAGALKG
jgi:ABC-type glycerol-3-phosphate transport system permease component